MVPGIHDAASDMFALGCCLFGAGGFLDVDGQLGLGPGSHRASVAWVHEGARRDAKADGRQDELGVVQATNGSHVGSYRIGVAGCLRYESEPVAAMKVCLGKCDKLEFLGASHTTTLSPLPHLFLFTQSV